MKRSGKPSKSRPKTRRREDTRLKSKRQLLLALRLPLPALLGLKALALEVLIVGRWAAVGVILLALLSERAKRLAQMAPS